MFVILSGVPDACQDLLRSTTHFLSIPGRTANRPDRVRTRISDCGCCGLAKLVIAALAGTALDPPDDRIVMTRLLQERGGTGRGARHSLRLGKPRPGPLVFAVISLMS
jgi:hypothetical protein